MVLSSRHVGSRELFAGAFRGRLGIVFPGMAALPYDLRGPRRFRPVVAIPSSDESRLSHPFLS
jgi:hypothetical protein